MGMETTSQRTLYQMRKSEGEREMILKTDIIERQKSKIHQKQNVIFKDKKPKKSLWQKIKDKIKGRK